MEPETIIRQALGSYYEIQSIIGKGGMATVYKAVQISLNRPVALKVVHQNLVHDEEFIRRFLREAQVCASLNHSNIVTVYDVGSVGSVHFISMEYLEGKTLRDMVKSKGTLSPEETVKYIIPVAEVLAFMHKRRIVHRDVKSSNIFITRSGRVVLMDFGIVSSGDQDPMSFDGAILGTPEYMSPEQAEGREKIDGRSDIYSLGMVMYECLTGRLPFQSDNHITTLHRVLHDSPPTITSLNPSVPKWLSGIVTGCLVKDRSSRIQDGNALAYALLNKERPRLASNSENGKTRKLIRDEIHASQGFNSSINQSQSKKKPNKLLVAILLTTTIIMFISGYLLLYPSAGGSFQTHGANTSALAKSDIMSQGFGPAQSTMQVDTQRTVEAEGDDNERQLTDEVEQFLISGDQMMNSGNFEAAMSHYKSALQFEPENVLIKQKVQDAGNKLAEFQISSGDNYMARNLYDMAITQYNNALQINRGDNLIRQKIATAQAQKIRVLLDSGDYHMDNYEFELALEKFNKARQISPSNVSVAERIARLNMERNKYEEQQVLRQENRDREILLGQLGIQMILVENKEFGNYWIGKTEVTQKLWTEIMGINPSYFKGNSLPVENVDYNDIQQFLQKLNQKTGMNFRLPTEKEWEFAALGGDKSKGSKYSGSEILSEVAWYVTNSSSVTHSVAKLIPNELNLYDMSGNVWEWCSTFNGNDRIAKGGSWRSLNTLCAISHRMSVPSDEASYQTGFRLCRND